MKTWRLMVAGMMVFVVTASIRAEKKDEKQDNAKLLIGTWKVTTADKGAPLAIGDSTEFSKDGKSKTTRRKAGKEGVSEGSYNLEKDKLVITFKSEKGVSNIVLTIKKITDTELVLTHDEGGKVIEFRKALPAAAMTPQDVGRRWYGGLPRFSPGRFYHGGFPPGR